MRPERQLGEGGRVGYGVYQSRRGLRSAGRGPALSWSELNEARSLQMVTGIVLLRVRRDLVNDVASALSAMDGISEVYSVSGQYDLVAMVRVKDNDGLAEVVTRQMLKVEGIESSETMLSFRCYSAHDLEGMFSIGS